jgi:hypothetical integral membrane protein (TIGR02206 family)
MTAANAFPTFGPLHLALLAAVPGTALALAAWVRARPGAERPVRVAFAAALAANQLAYLAYAGLHGWIDPPRGLPLELCDVAVWLAVAALLRAPEGAAARVVDAGELLWFVGLAGTTQALLTPDLGVAFPSYPGVKFFVGHGGTVAAGVFLAAAGRLRPRPGAWWRALLALDAYAAPVFLLDRLGGTNYLYLAAKPAVPSLLDRLGPWPWYLVSCEALAAGLFFLLELPFRRSRRSAS